MNTGLYVCDKTYWGFTVKTLLSQLHTCFGHLTAGKINLQLSFISTNTHLAPNFLSQLSNHSLHLVPNSCRDKLCSSCYI